MSCTDDNLTLLPKDTTLTHFSLNNSCVLRYSKITPDAYAPVRGSEDAAGYNLKAAHQYVVKAHSKELIMTDLQIAIPRGCYGRIAPRSGHSWRYFLDIGGGVIDRDYRGNVGIIMYNHSDSDFVVESGDRVAQLICVKIENPFLQEMLIVRPNWPEMYRNLTLVGLADDEGGSGEGWYFTPRGGTDQPSTLVYCLVALVLIFHLKQHISSESSLIFGLLCSSIGLLLAPVITLLLLLFAVYRRLVIVFLSFASPKFVGLMDGSDAYWALEEDTSKAVINILAYVQFQPKDKEGAADLRTVIKATIQSRLLTDPKLFKLKCKRRLTKFGYYYWEEAKTDIDEHIRWMNINSVNEDILENFVSESGNKPLPYENQSFWEVLVCPKSVIKDEKSVFPVLFRVHHSVGDGISLVSMFLNSFTDNNNGEKPKIPLQQIRQKQKLTRRLTKEVSRLDELFNKITKTFGSTLSKRSSISKMHEDFKKINRHCIYRMTGLLQKISLLMFAPIVLSSQFILGHDNNILHNQKLAGEKHLCWKSSENLFNKIKKIKKELKCHFTDVILMAVSNSLEKYFLSNGQSTEAVTLVIPARLPQEEVINGISVPTNAFTVAMMSLPISHSHKLQAICLKTRKLRIEPHYLVNFWLLKVACTYFPLTLIRRGLRSSQATLALSNIPGPERQTKIDGNLIDDLVFWVPNRDTTGVGVSVLSYAGKLNLGLQVDQALVPSKETVQNLMDGIIGSIDKMYECVKSL